MKPPQHPSSTFHRIEFYQDLFCSGYTRLGYEYIVNSQPSSLNSWTTDSFHTQIQYFNLKLRSYIFVRMIKKMSIQPQDILVDFDAISKLNKGLPKNNSDH